MTKLALSFLVSLVLVFGQGGSVQDAQDHDLGVAVVVGEENPVPYPPLARSARIQDTVRFSVEWKNKIPQIELVSGHPLLTQVAQYNLERWRWGVSPGKVLVDYNFSLGSSRSWTETKVHKHGGTVERFFRKMFRKPTQYEEVLYFCEDGGSSREPKVEEKSKGYILVTIVANVACLQASSSANQNR